MSTGQNVRRLLTIARLTTSATSAICLLWWLPAFGAPVNNKRVAESVSIELPKGVSARLEGVDLPGSRIRLEVKYSGDMSLRSADVHVLAGKAQVDFSDPVRPLLFDLLKAGADTAGRGWLGFRTEDVGGSCRITRVTPHSPAEATGISEGDTIISINGASVASTSDVQAALIGKAGGIVRIATRTSSNSDRTVEYKLPEQDAVAEGAIIVGRLVPFGAKARVGWTCAIKDVDLGKKLMWAGPDTGPSIQIWQKWPRVPSLAVTIIAPEQFTAWQGEPPARSTGGESMHESPVAPPVLQLKVGEASGVVLDNGVIIDGVLVVDRPDTLMPGGPAAGKPPVLVRLSDLDITALKSGEVRLAKFLCKADCPFAGWLLHRREPQ